MYYTNGRDVFLEPIPSGVIQGDCIDGMATLADLSVDHLITDPPYSEHTHRNGRKESRRFGIPRDLKRRLSGSGHAGRAREVVDRALGFDPVDEDLALSASEQFSRITRRWVLVFSDVENVSLWKGALEVAGLEYVRTCAWVKPGAPPQFSGDRPAAGFECIVLAHRPGKKRWNGGGKHGVWTVPRCGGDERTEHTTQKPLGLMEALIRDFTDPGELICDPFAGSGTTLVAAKKLGRRASGWEIQEQYVALANERIESTREQISLLGR